MIFDYPEPRNARVHGPAGYSTYESYRPWLRDEFTFRCVYCLKREAWGRATGEFELDHFEPQSLAPRIAFDYLNLVYACRRCNLVKLDQSIDDPLATLSSDFAVVSVDGSIFSDRIETQRLIRRLDLNSPNLRKWRVMWLRIVDLARERDSQLYRQLTGFPNDLPDLSQPRPPSNTNPSGIEISWYAKRERGQLPDEY